MALSAQAAGEAKVAIALEDGLLRLSLNHAARRNALGEQMIAELQAALDDAGANEHVAAVVIAASGSVFSSGHDLAEITAHRRDNDGGRKYFEGLLARCSHLMQSIATLPKPVLAEVQGLASAAGCQLAATCDLIVAAEFGGILHAGREYRTVLRDADGGADPRRFRQTCDGNAAYRGQHPCCGGAADRARQSRRQG